MTNLYYGLSQEDLEELFSKVGPIEKLWIKYDRSGRSLGEAYVVYRRRDDCFEAIRRFDGRKAAGQEIYLSLLDDQGVVSSLRTRFGVRPEERDDRHGRREREGRGRGRGARDRRRRGDKERRVPKTADELDAELEAYMGRSSNQGANEGSNGKDGGAEEKAAGSAEGAAIGAGDDMAMEA